MGETEHGARGAASEGAGGAAGDREEFASAAVLGRPTLSRRAQVGYWLAGAAAVLLVLLMVGNVIQDRSEGARDREELVEIRAIAETIESQQDINTRLLELVEASGDRIEDCTTAGGECFREAQARTAEAVSGINEGTLRIVVAAQTCADRGLSGRLLTRCTIGLLGQ